MLNLLKTITAREWLTIARDAAIFGLTLAAVILTCTILIPA